MSDDLVFYAVEGTLLDGLSAAAQAGAREVTVCDVDGVPLVTVTLGEPQPGLPIVDFELPWIGPAPCEWSPDTIAWCQRCDRPIRRGRPYEAVPNDRGGSWAGFRHRVCLEVVR